MADIEFEVDRKSIVKTLEDIEAKVNEGAEEGLEDTLDIGQEAAEDRVKQKRNPYNSPHLRSSFNTHTLEIGDKLKGFITNPREYAAYVDQGVSGTERQRPDTEFEYTDSMPPLEEMIKYVESEFSNWNIDTDFDPPFNPNNPNSKYHQPLSEYDVDENYRKERIVDTEQIEEGVEVIFDNGSNTFEGEIKSYNQERNEVDVLHSSDIVSTIDLDEDRAEIIAREDITTLKELEKGDEAIFDELLGDDLGRDIYGKVVRKEYDNQGRLMNLVVNDQFSFARNNNIKIPVKKPRYYLAKRDESDYWADDINLAETVENTPEKYTTPEEYNYEINRLLYSNSDESGKAIIEDGDGERYITTLKRSDAAKSNYVFKAGYNEDGEHVEFHFSEASDIADEDFSVIGIHRKVQQWLNLEEGDDIIIDVNPPRYSPQNLEQWGIDEDTDLYSSIRGTVANVREKNTGRRIKFETFQASTVVNRNTPFGFFENTREAAEGTWRAKDLQPGDQVTFNYNDETVSGRYLGYKSERDRDKSYRIGNVDIYSEEKDRIFRDVSDWDIETVTKDSDWRTFTREPDDIEYPSKFEEFFYDGLGGVDQDKQYYAWDYRKERFITIEGGSGRNVFSRVGDGEKKPYRHEMFDKDDLTYPIKIVGKERDEPGVNVSEYDIPASEATNDERLVESTPISNDWFEFLDEVDKEQLKDEIGSGENINPEQAEILQAYLYLTTDEEIPYYNNRSQTFKPSSSDFVTYGKDVDVEQEDKTRIKQAFETQINKINPVISSHLLKSLNTVKAKNFSDSKSGEHNTGKGSVSVDPDDTDQGVGITMGHEVSHEINELLGLGHKNYSSIDNRGKETSEWEFGITRDTTSSDSRDDFLEMKEQWEKYKENVPEMEVRKYQRRNGAEFLTVNRNFYISATDRLKEKAPELFMILEGQHNNRDLTTDFEDLEAGSFITFDVDDPANASIVQIEEITERDGDTVILTEDDREITRYSIGDYTWRGLI